MEQGAFAGIESIHLPAGITEDTCQGLTYNEDVPNYVFMAIEDFGKLTRILKPSAIRGFLTKWKRNELTEADQTELSKILKSNLMRTFDTMGEYIPLYEFATNCKIINKQNLYKLLERTASIECRAILLDYSQKYANNSHYNLN